MISKFGKKDIITCLQSSIGAAMHYLCCDKRPAMPDRMTSMYKEADFKHRAQYLSYQLSFVGIVTSD